MFYRPCRGRSKGRPLILRLFRPRISQVQYTDKKENKIFLIHKEIQNGAVAVIYD
jgi:hypothetical protein